MFKLTFRTGVEKAGHVAQAEEFVSCLEVVLASLLLPVSLTSVFPSGVDLTHFFMLCFYVIMFIMYYLYIVKSPVMNEFWNHTNF